MSNEILSYHFKAYYLAQSHGITAVVLNQEGPVIVREVKGNKDGCPIHLDICSDEMRRRPLARPPQSEMHGAYVLNANRRRPNQNYVDDFIFWRLENSPLVVHSGKSDCKQFVPCSQSVQRHTVTRVQHGSSI